MCLFALLMDRSVLSTMVLSSNFYKIARERCLYLKMSIPQENARQQQASYPVPLLLLLFLFPPPLSRQAPAPAPPPV